MIIILYLQAAFISPWPSIEKQKIVSHLLGQLELSKVQVATDSLSPRLKDDGVESSLLALCIGNRSAVLFEMNRIEVCNSRWEGGIRCPPTYSRPGMSC